MNVLVVGPVDEGELVALELRRWGHQATLVENGELCIDRFITERFDAVALAIDLPGRSGAATIEALRWAPRGSEVRMVLWGTSASWLQVQQACRELDAHPAPSPQEATRALLFGVRPSDSGRPGQTRRYSVQAVQEVLRGQSSTPSSEAPWAPEQSAAESSSVQSLPREPLPGESTQVPVPQISSPLNNPRHAQELNALLGDASLQMPTPSIDGEVSAGDFDFDDRTEELEATEIEPPPSIPGPQATPRLPSESNAASGPTESWLAPKGIDLTQRTPSLSVADAAALLAGQGPSDDASGTVELASLGAPRPGQATPAVPQNAALEDRVNNVLRAERLYRRAQRSLERQQPARAIRALAEALTLRPGEAEFELLLAWAEHQDAPDCSERLRRLHRAATVHRRAPRASELLAYADEALHTAS